MSISTTRIPVPPFHLEPAYHDKTDVPGKESMSSISGLRTDKLPDFANSTLLESARVVHCGKHSEDALKGKVICWTKYKVCHNHENLIGRSPHSLSPLPFGLVCHSEYENLRRSIGLRRETTNTVGDSPIGLAVSGISPDTDRDRPIRTNLNRMGQNASGTGLTVWSA